MQFNTVSGRSREGGIEPPAAGAPGEIATNSPQLPDATEEII